MLSMVKVEMLTIEAKTTLTMITVKKVNLENLKKDLKFKNQNEYEEVNGILLKKNRLDTIITLDNSSKVISVHGKNPKKIKIGDLYE